MKRKILSPTLYFLFMIFISQFSFSQNPLVKQWDYRFGGTSYDLLESFQQTKDMGFILGGYSESGSGGDKTQATIGTIDMWIVKTDSLGNKQWDKDFGGSDDDNLSSLHQTRDRGYIFGGESYSPISGDKTQECWGECDFWIVKTDSLGNKQWDKDFGGTDVDFFSALQQTKDKGYILGGSSLSSLGGDKTENGWGSYDYWIVKIDSLGIKQWDSDFGGTNGDFLTSLQQTTDGGYILGGYSISQIGGDKTQNVVGGPDFWIVKTDSLGNKLWDKDFGGNDQDILYSLKQTSDNGYILAGVSNSVISGNKSQTTWGYDDYWLVKLDSSGNKEWDRDFGGIGMEYLNQVFVTTDKGYLLAGHSYSPLSGDKTEGNLGSEQTWVVKTDSTGIKQWDKTLHTNTYQDDEIGLAIQIQDSCYVMANSTSGGIAGDKTQDSQGGRDYWLIKFCDTTLGIIPPLSNFLANEVSGCTNSCFDFTNESLNAVDYQWYFPGANPDTSTQLNPSNICYINAGEYDVMLIASSAFASDTIIQTAYITIFTPLVISISQNGNFLSCNPVAISYQWSLNGSQIPGATSQTLFISQTGNYSVDVIDSNGCSSSAIINITSVPSPNFSVADSNLCEKFCTNFFDQSTNNPTAWLWQFPGGDPSSSTEQNPNNICYDLPGIYDVTLITTNVSGSDTLTLHNYITVYPTPPIPTITQNGYTLTSSPAEFYQWQLDAADIPGATNQSYNVLQTGFYTVVVSDSNGCVNSTTLYVEITGIDEVSDANFSVYPNPSNGKFIVEFSGEKLSGEVSIDMVNSLSQNIYSSSLIPSSSITKKEIDLGNSSAGVYFIEIKSSDHFLREKIIVSK